MMTRLPRIVNGFPDHDMLCDCLDCRTAWEDWHEAKYADRRHEAMSLQDIELRQAKSATDAEWQSFLCGEYPRGEEGVAL